MDMKKFPNNRPISISELGEAFTVSTKNSIVKGIFSDSYGNQNTRTIAENNHGSFTKHDDFSEFSFVSFESPDNDFLVEVNAL